MTVPNKPVCEKVEVPVKPKVAIPLSCQHEGEINVIDQGDKIDSRTYPADKGSRSNTGEKSVVERSQEKSFIQSTPRKY